MDAQNKKNIYCIWVKTGKEESYVKEMNEVLSSPDSALCGELYHFKKKMRLKNGKEYFEEFFPGYVFFETSETDVRNFLPLTKSENFVRFLPRTDSAHFLSDHDVAIVQSILKYGSTIDIVHVEFNEDDRIVILDGSFKDFNGRVIAVNRRNKRVNVQFDFMNGLKVVGLTYEEVKKS